MFMFVVSCVVFVWCVYLRSVCFFFFKQKTAYEMRISDWSSDVCSSDLFGVAATDAHVHDHAVKAFLSLPGGGRRAIADRAAAVSGAGLGDHGFQPLQIGRASCRDRVCQYV